MFKYGSLRLFLVKFTLGCIFAVFAVIYIGSLVSYDESDPGFLKPEVSSFEDAPINNYFNLFGAKLSSYSIKLIGFFSYLVGLFILIESTKSLLGIRVRHLVLKLFSNFVGVFLMSIFIYSYGLEKFQTGIISEFLAELLNGYLFEYFENKYITYLFNLFLFLLGLVLILFSFSFRFKFIKTIFSFFKVLKYLKYINILPALNFTKKYQKNKGLRNKSEPTINKSNFFKNKNTRETRTGDSKKSEMEQFKFSLPEKSLLVKSQYRSGVNRELSKTNTNLANKLEQTLSEYGVDGKIIGYKSGPIVTLFEFIPNAGIKSSKVIGLSDDIARAMSSLSARISSQPGKTSLGIEIPNQKREGVLFGDIIEDERYIANESALTLALGKDISGEKIFTDLEKMPHLLIAGTTGSGKSVGINTMILSLLYKFKPNECKLILIDPKMLELNIYEDIPHLLTPVVTDPKKAVFALKWVVKEMENRYKLMSSVNVKNISTYNNKVLRTLSSGRKLFREVQTGIDPDTRIPIIEKKEIKLEKMPFIVVVIDEMADLMMVAGKEVETLVQRLAQMARASGIHLITATQRPSVDVITGTIKANFPSRISYKVASKFDSRTILNEMGAEQLLGSGDMLFLENGGNIKRLHGGFVSETEVERVVTSIKNQATFDYKKEISLDEIDNITSLEKDLVSDNQDELYSKAVDVIVSQQRVSTSYIQRYLQIGYNRAARIIEKMEEDGIISEANNAGKRHVLKKK